MKLSLLRLFVLSVILCYYSVCSWFHTVSLQTAENRKLNFNTLYMGRASNVRAATKARTDAAKAKNNCRFAKKIIISVKNGGPDPVANRLLAQTIAEAKIANVPKDIIVRNIEKASTSATSDFKESIFEFYGHGGAGLLVSVLSDNDNRASAEVQLVAKKHNLKPAAINSVKFKFNTKARLEIHEVINEELLLELCLENGIDDYTLITEGNGDIQDSVEHNHSVIYVNTKDMVVLRNILSERKCHIETKLVNIPTEGYVSQSDADFEANMAAIAAFDALDDVDYVEHNIDMSTSSDNI